MDDVEIEIFNREEKEIPSALIGEILMDKLKELDPVAYVRFASVYREFKDVNTFMNELKKMLGWICNQRCLWIFQDMQKAISDMEKDQVLQQYQYFVGTQDIGVKKTPLDTGISALRSGENFSL